MEPVDDASKKAAQEVEEASSAALATFDEASEQKAIIPPSGDSSSVPSQSLTQVHRFLVVTRERFMVLDSGGSGIGSTAVVKSNHHLTEVCHAV